MRKSAMKYRIALYLTMLMLYGAHGKNGLAAEEALSKDDQEMIAHMEMLETMEMTQDNSFDATIEQGVEDE